LQPRCLPRKAIYYCRYADDFLVILCDASKAEAQQMKAAIAAWMQANLGLTLNQDKTHITHWQDKVRFLGYELEGRRNRHGTGWLHLGIPKDAVRHVVTKVQQTTRYSQAPEYDVFHNVNAIARGWINYYRSAHNLNVTGGKLSLVIYWRTVHYLAKRHRCSIARTMKDHYARDPKTGCLGLYTHTPAKSQTSENRTFVWHKTPSRLSFAAPSSYSVQDEQPYIDNGWAKGRSLHKKVETREKAKQACEHCGTTEGKLYVHHPNRLAKAKRVTKGMGHVAQSGLEQKTILLCHTCHTAYHANS
jgi:hypothetical protein